MPGPIGVQQLGNAVWATCREHGSLGPAKNNEHAHEMAEEHRTSVHPEWSGNLDPTIEESRAILDKHGMGALVV